MKMIIDKVKLGDIVGVKQDLERFSIDPKQIFYDTYKQTPIFYATHIKDAQRCIEMTNFFIEAGVDPAYKDSLRQTAIYYAAKEGQFDMVRLLFKHGCKLNEKDNHE